MTQPVPTVMTCTVEMCPAYEATPTADAGWTVDTIGRLFCPSHPVDKACRICGADKGNNRIICSACATGDEL